MFDAGFGKLANALRREGIKSGIFRECGITDMSIDTVKSLLSFHTSLQRDAEWKASLEIGGVIPIVCLRSLDLRGNAFSALLLVEVVSVLSGLPMTRLDLRDNEHIPLDVLNAIRRKVPHVSIKVNSSVKTKKSKQKKQQKSTARSRSQSKQAPSETTVPAASEVSPKDKPTTAVRKSRPRKEEATWDTPPEDSEKYVLAPGVYVAGRRAPEFLAYVTRLCNRAEDVYLPKDRR
jgi:hypothetical protein